MSSVEAVIYFENDGVAGCGFPKTTGVKSLLAKYKEEQYDKMAKIIRENLDMDMIYRILERKDVR